MIKSLILNNKFKVLAISGYLFLISTIVFFQYQKDGLRDNITKITSEKQSQEIFYRSEIERITTKHNQIIKDMIGNEEKLRLEREIERLKNQREFERQKNKELIKDIYKLNQIEDICLDTEITEEIGELLK